MKVNSPTVTTVNCFASFGVLILYEKGEKQAFFFFLRGGCNFLFLNWKQTNKMVFFGGGGDSPGY